MVDVLVVDDHPIVRQGFKQILANVSDIAVTAEAASGDEALRKVREQHYDVVLLDIGLPGMNGLAVLEHLKTEKPRLPVLMVSVYPEERYAMRVLQMGAHGYLTKGTSVDELIHAVRRVAQGRRYISSSVADIMAARVAGHTNCAPHETLSTRELQVLGKIASGKTTAEIAEQLSLSEKTVSTYKRRILDKMEMTNTAQLIRYVTENDLV